MKKPTLVLTYEFPARPQRVFDVLTQAEHLNQWFTSDARIDLQVGGQMTNGDGEQCKFSKVAVPTELIFTYRHPQLEVETEVDMLFEASQPLGGTRLRIVQKGLDPKQVSDAGYRWMNDRWNYMAAALKHYLDRRSRLSQESWRAEHKPVYEARP